MNTLPAVRPPSPRTMRNTITTLRSALTIRLILLTLALTLSLGITAHAQVSFLIQPANQTGNPGDLLTYTATLTNTGSSEVFLNSDTFNLGGAALLLDDGSFFDNFPLSLQGGEIASGNLFTVLIGPSVAPGIYNGTFTIQGGPTDASSNDIATQSFQITVRRAAAPEPASFALLAISGLPLAGMILRRRIF
jgi:hypothetical protein